MMTHLSTPSSDIDAHNFQDCDFQGFAQSLIRADGDIHLAPIRHHSPACALAVRQMIRELKPSHVLIEAPADFETHIDNILHEETSPPIAIAAIVERQKDARLAAYYPFCGHSPEYVAMVEARALGAQIAFIDLPSTEKAFRNIDDNRQKVSLIDETAFDTGDFIEGLRAHYNCRDGYELWDHLFEARMGNKDWRRFFAEVGAYCAGMRAATPPEQLHETGDDAREDHMRRCVEEAKAKGGRIVAIIGGFHAPALLAPDEAPEKKAGKIKETAEDAISGRSYLIRYGYKDLDALNGYAAGLPQPGYYQMLWDRALENGGQPNWRETGLDLVSDFTWTMREEGFSISLPAQVEMLRVAESLAQMRGRPGIMRHDLVDGACTALVKGEAGAIDPWLDRLYVYLRGHKLGEITVNAGSPPLVEDARRRAKALRIDVSDTLRRRRKLDIRRKPAHLAASRYFHAMALLGTGFGELEAGPDYLNNIATDRLFEEWSFAWSPRVEGHLVEFAARADQLPQACLCVIEDRLEELCSEGKASDVAAMAKLLSMGIVAGLGRELAPLLDRLSHDIAANGDFANVAGAFRQLHLITISNGLLSTPQGLDLEPVRNVAYRRLIYLCDDLPQTPPDATDERIEALRMVAELLRDSDDEALDPGLFDEAIDRVVEQNLPQEILGAILGILVNAGRRSPDDLKDALRGHFHGCDASPEGRFAVLNGLLATRPDSLLRFESVLLCVDEFLGSLSMDEFLKVLPYMRRALTRLNPRETDHLAAHLAAIHGGEAGQFVSINLQMSEADLATGLGIDAEIREAIRADGLEDWFGDLLEPAQSAIQNVGEKQ